MARIRLALFALLPLSIACASLQRTTTGQRISGWSPTPQSSVFLMPTPDAVERGEGVVGGSGANVNAALRDQLLAHQVKVAPTEKKSLREAIEEAASAGYLYVLKSTLTEWEDNATEWSANPDKASLSLELYAVETKQLVATGTHRVVGGTLELLPKPTNRFIPELADHALAKVFGWRPTVYYD
jgi:DNA-binding transcriptional regulator YiaG